MAQKKKVNDTGLQGGKVTGWQGGEITGDEVSEEVEETTDDETTGDEVSEKVEETTDDGATGDEVSEEVDKTILATLLDKHGVDVLYENSRGELFPNEDYALLSEKGDKKKVKIHKR